MSRQPSNVNEYVLDRAVRRGLYLERYARREAAMLSRIFDEKYVNEMLDLARRSGRLPMSHRRDPKAMRLIIERQKSLADELAKDLGGRASSSLLALAKSEVADSVETLFEATYQLRAYASPPLAMIRNVVLSKPFQGDILSEHFAAISKANMRRFSTALMQGFAAGDDMDGLVARVVDSGFQHTASQRIRATVRTAVNHVATATRDEVYVTNKSVIKSVQIVATLDNRTTDICIDIDGKTFPVDSGERPPFHYGCRTTTAPVLKTFEELGIKGIKEPTDSQRASMDGAVPETMSAEKWFDAKATKAERKTYRSLFPEKRTTKKRRNSTGSTDRDLVLVTPASSTRRT